MAYVKKPRLYVPCDSCCAWFETLRSNKYTCNRCMKKAHKKPYNQRHPRKPGWRPKERGPFECQGCGKKYLTIRPKGEGEKYCSRGCAFADVASRHACLQEDASVARTFRAHLKAGYRLSLKGCAVCGRATERNHCSAYCASQAVWAIRVMGQVYVCSVCSVQFCPLLGNWGRRVCSDECDAKQQKEARRKDKAARRARMRGVYRESVSPRQVFDRDGWRCQICGKRTPKERRGTLHSNAPELDHRVPISKGGPHTYDNVQCACRACNIAKGNRSEVGQMPLLPVVAAGV